MEGISDRLRAAHRCSRNNRDELQASKMCGCFYCCRVFSTSEIKPFHYRARGETTAFCPFCGIDSILADTQEAPLTHDFLKEMHDAWFTPRV